MNINVSYNQNTTYKLTKDLSDTTQKVSSSFENGLSMFNMYSKFFPTRSEVATNLGYTVEHPSYESFSASKDISEVAKDARVEMDTQYKLMKDSEKPFDYNSFEGRDANELFKNFDRRALYAVASNEGNNFSKQEQDMARSIMSSQLGLASGFYSGPNKLAKDYAQNFDNNYTSQADAMLKFLNGVSTEEKSSSKWMLEIIGAENLKSSSLDENNKPKSDELSFIKILLKADKEFAQNLEKTKNNNYYTSSNENGASSFAISA